MVTRRSMYVTLLLIAVARALRAHPVDDGVVATLVWSALGVVFTPRTCRVPSAIVRAPRDARLRRWRHAVWLRLGKMPILGHGYRTHLGGARGIG